MLRLTTPDKMSEMEETLRQYEDLVEIMVFVEEAEGVYDIRYYQALLSHQNCAVTPPPRRNQPNQSLHCESSTNSATGVTSTDCQ